MSYILTGICTLVSQCDYLMQFGSSVQPVTPPDLILDWFISSSKTSSNFEMFHENGRRLTGNYKFCKSGGNAA